MRELLKGKLVRLHLPTGFRDLGRVVYDCRDCDDILYIPLPAETRCGKGQDARLRAPKRLKRVQIPLLGNGHEVTLVDFVPPDEWILTDEELSGNSLSLDKTRRNLPAWLAHRENKKALIAPILKDFGDYELLELGLLNAKVRDHVKEAGVKDERIIVQAMRRYYFGCGHPNALLPNWAEVGSRGIKKFSVSKTGRPSAKSLKPDAKPEFVVAEGDREQLSNGWKTYKKKGVSVRVAYLQTSSQYWPGPERVNDSYKNQYFLKPPHQRPTFAQFKWAARLQGLSASRVNMGEQVFSLTKRALIGSAKDGIYALAQVAVIDSTSEDQTPVSSLNRLKVLPSTYRTVVVEAWCGYILGVYCGFEHPSTLTSLLALLNCVSSKVEFCARYNIHITEGEWFSRLPKRIRGDNGELKSEKGISTMSASEVASEFVRSYAGDLKSGAESSHHSLHRIVDHHAAGSTQGRRRERGEDLREKDACRTFDENMPFVIKAILRHNNEEPVDHLLSVEMRQDGVKPTRRAIYEWLLSKGYAASEPAHLDMLLAQCLPRFKGAIRRDGIHVFDPRDSRRLIPQMVYASEWLRESRLSEQAGNGSIPCEVQIDPQNLAVCYITRKNKLHQLHRKSSDPLLNELPLLEYLLMTDDDLATVNEMRGFLESSDAQLHAGNRAQNRASRAAKKAALAQAAAGDAPVASRYDKRKNREIELEHLRMKRLGIVDSQALQKSPEGSEALCVPPPPPVVQSVTADLMAASRRARAR
ncbi:hypothetical protein LJR066_000714 [Acidovorax sp. LjRoot66]|uniref:hypothetical protein n=1 Tax=Acidovorax sp. LjRoot66 TaxID=3342334 RepID=UPI003ED064D1